MEDHFGGCPECGRNDGYRNVYKNHFFMCHEHGIVWLAGYNLFSSWHDESDGHWARNLEELGGYTFYDHEREQLVGALSELVSFEELVPSPTSEDELEEFLRNDF